MIIIGLTGSVGMGKSTAAAALRRMGYPVHDADAAIHAMFVPGGIAVAPIRDAFATLTGVVTPAGAIDRRVLGAHVFGNPAALRRLEAITHPLVRADTESFLARAARRQTPAVVLDVPLLFEGGGWRRCDLIVVVSAPSFIQRQRVLARPGMDAARLRAILAKQTPDRIKRRHADLVVQTGRHLGAAWRDLRRLDRMIQTVRRRGGGRFWPTPRFLPTAPPLSFLGRFTGKNA